MTIDVSFWGWVTLVVFVVVVGVVSGRILGIRRGFLRATVAGVLGLVTGVLITAVILRNDLQVTFGDVLSVGFGFSLLATMVYSIALEVVLRRRQFARQVSTRTRVRTFFTIGGRLIEVGRLARRNGLAGPLLASRSTFATEEGGLRMKRFLEDCGGMFVKFGQIASTRSDLLPPAMVDALSDLQSSARPVAFEQIRASVEGSLKAPMETVFAEFSADPLAAASIGQTHLATTLDGRSVVVKVRRPNIEVGVARDAAVLRWASKIAVRRSEAARALGLASVSEELIRSIDKELSYLTEASFGKALRKATLEAKSDGIAIPDVFTSLSTDSVLVMERVHGKPVSDDAMVDACGVPRAVLAERLLKTFLGDVFDGGVFHADPHPGNILIDSKGTLWLIDFGAVGIIDPVTLEAMQMMALGLGTRDPALLARAIRALSGAQASEINLPVLEAEVSRLLSEQLAAGGFDPNSLQDVLGVMDRHNIPVPPTFALIARAMVTLEGTLRGIDPAFDLAGAATSHFGSALHFSGQETRDVLQREALRSLPSLRALPGLTEDIALQVRSGRVQVRLDAFAGSGAGHVTRWVDQMVFAGVAAFGLLASALMLAGAVLADPDRDTSILAAVGYGGLIVASVMLMRVVAQIVRRQPSSRDSPSWSRDQS